MKLMVVFLTTDPPNSTVLARGMQQIPTHATILTKGLPVQEIPVPIYTNVTERDVLEIMQELTAPLTDPLPPAVHPTINPVTPDANKLLNLDFSTVCPVNVEVLREALEGHPDQGFVLKLCVELKEGARIGYSGPRIPRFSKNLPTAAQNPEIVSANLLKEVQLGRTAGPFTSPPFENFQISPIGIIPKKHSNKFRTIFHLSFPKSGDSSINHYISSEDFSLQYITIDKAISQIQNLGQFTFMGKTDIESAFRIFPVHKEDWELLGMFWKGYYYFDKVLPFGLRSAPFLFNQLSDAVEWVLINKFPISAVCHILDDFFICEPPEDGPLPDKRCKESLAFMLSTFRQLNIPIAQEKTIGPVQVIEFMGIILDSIRMEARLPDDKIQRIKAAFSQWSTRKSCTLKELQSLIGTLNFACKVIPPGRPFLQRMILLTKGIQKPHHHIKLSKGFHKDLELWQQFVNNWNGAGFFLSSTWSTLDTLHLHTDASGTIGYGGIFGSQWFQGKWLSHQTLSSPGISIDWQELYAIVIACHLWGKFWCNKRIIFFCDNQVVVDVINTKRSKSPRMMDLVRNLTLTTLHNNTYIKAEHIPGKLNSVADALSRFQMQRFVELAPSADKVPLPIPAELYSL